MPANYVLLERIELNASASSVSFLNIPQSGYTDLKVVISSRVDISTNYTDWIKIGFNGSSTSFTYRELEGAGSGTPGSYSGSGQLSAVSVGGSATANTYSNCEIYIPNFTSSNNKSYSIDGVTENNATSSMATLNAGLWSNTAAISSVTFSPNAATVFLQYSTFSLYGLAATGTTPAIAPKASGGNITTDGTYWYHTFLSSGTFTPATALTCDALVVAGGGGTQNGGAGAGASGGGGAGGLLAFTSQSFAANTSYTATVGAGGSSSTGSDSQLGSLTLVKGGGLGATADTIGSNGGSGGGNGMRYIAAVSTPTSGQGNAGGKGATSGSTGAGGGGGAGAAGADANSTNAGNGGIGVNTYSSWATATSTGDSGYYAGGGGGQRWYSGSGGTGGTGGGGAGRSSTDVTGNPGLTNTGGGAGGGNLGGSGGSGIVIVRYLVA